MQRRRTRFLPPFLRVCSIRCNCSIGTCRGWHQTKVVKTARERDGRLYGPAIFRIHYESHSYSPHIDHVVLREKRFNYAVARFTHQFAGVLCVQNADSAGPGVQAVLHRCLWTEEIQPYIAEGGFHEYAAAHGVEHCEVALEPGDMYFFNTRCIHEVPAVQGDDPRVSARRLHWLCRRRRGNLRVVLTRVAVHAHRPRAAADRPFCATRGLGEATGAAARPAGWGQ